MSTLAIKPWDLLAFEHNRVVLAAQKVLYQPAKTIVTVINPRSPGNKHDFSSEADYWWPNPEEPAGPYIHRDGLSNPGNFISHRELLLDFAITVGSLTAAWQCSRKEMYAHAAARHLLAWFVDVETRMTPNLQYAQAIKGVCTGRGIGLIDTVHLAEVALAVMELKDSPAFKNGQYERIISWFSDYLNWLCTHPYGLDERDTTNNHATCWALQVAAFALLTNNQNVLTDCRRRFTQILLPRQMTADGSFPRELGRTKPYGYSIFNLDVFCALAQLLSTPEENLLTWQLPDQRSLIAGIEFLFPYLQDKQRWPYAQDVMYWQCWPIRQPALLFGALAADRGEWLQLWQSLPTDPEIYEVRRNYPVRNPSLWLR